MAGALIASQGTETYSARIRQAIALLLEIREESFDVIDDVVLPARVRRTIRSYEAALEVARAKARELVAAQRQAALALEEHGLSRRDAGEVLGIAGQRVQQLVTNEKG